MQTAQPPWRVVAAVARPGNRTKSPAKSSPTITNIANNRFIDLSLQIAEIERNSSSPSASGAIHSSVFMRISNSTVGVTGRETQVRKASQRTAVDSSRVLCRCAFCSTLHNRPVGRLPKTFLSERIFISPARFASPVAPRLIEKRRGSRAGHLFAILATLASACILPGVQPLVVDAGPTTAPFAWAIETADPGTGTGFHTSIALDRLGTPMISYINAAGGTVQLARRIGGNWSSEIVAGPGIFSGDTSVVIASNGTIEASYFDQEARAVVDATPNAGWFSRIRVDSRGVGHIAYYASSNGSLMYATEEGNGWSRSVIDSGGDAGFDLSFALDVNDRAQIAYYERRAGVLRYAIETSQGWVRETVDDTGVAGWYTGIATDALGFPHISYYDWSDGDLRYAEGKIGLQVRSLPASAINATSAVLHGELVALGNHSRAFVEFALRAVGTVVWAYRAAGNLTSAGSFRLLVTNLTANITYEFYAVALAGDESSQGATRSFQLSPAVPPAASYGLFASVGVGGAVAVAVGYMVFRRRRQRLTKAPDRTIR